MGKGTNRPKLAARLCPAVLACVAAGQAREPAPQQAPVFGSTVSVTRVKVAVLDEDDRPVAGLGAADFRVLDEGQEREIQVVLDPDESPLDLALVLDYSTSVADTWPDARERVHAFLEALSPRDCVHVLPFNSRVSPGLHGPPGDPYLRLFVDRFPMWGLTRLYDALFSAYAALGTPAAAASGPADPGSVETVPGACESGEQTPRRRQALVVLTDGADEGSDYSYRDVLMQAWRADTPVFSVAVGIAATSDRDLDGYRSLGVPRAEIEEIRTMRRQLAELARVSGGRMVTQQDIRDGYAEVLSLLRGYYVLGYRTPEPRRAGWHEVRVELRERAGRRVVSQPGYYSAEVDPAPAFDALAAAQAALAERRFEEALRWFDIAAGLDAGVGSPDLGMALAYDALGQLVLARAALERALARHPGLAAAHAQLASVAARQADYEAAWEHAIRARLGGGGVDDTIARLRVRTGDPADLQRRLARPVLFIVRPEVPGLEEQLRLGPVLDALGNAVESTPAAALTQHAGRATHYLRLDLDRITAEGVRGKLELWSVQGDRLADEKLRLGPQPSATQAAEILRRLLERLRR